jgi:hypothetical protein
MTGGRRDYHQAPVAFGARAVLIPTFAMIVPTALGLAALPVGAQTAEILGLAGLVAVAGFTLLLGRLSTQPEELAEALARTLAAARVMATAKVAAKTSEASTDGWADGLDRRVSVLCAAAFALMGALCGGLALASWLSQGPGAAVGLGVAAVAFLFAALAAGSQVLRR